MELPELHAHALVRISGVFGQIIVMARTGNLSENNFGALGSAVHDLRIESEVLGLPATLAQVNRIDEYVRSWGNERSVSDSSFRLLSQMAGMALQTLSDELAARQCYVLPPQRREYVSSGLAIDQNIRDAFPSVVDELTEAGKCYGFGRSTATVFHLMRALEIPLAALLKTLGITKHSPTWNAYLSAMAEAIKVMFPDKSRAHAEKREYFTVLEGQLRAIKDAWRNPTMHEIGKNYTDETAHELIVLVRGLFREAAKELRE
jgi:hypothetical protein